MINNYTRARAGPEPTSCRAVALMRRRWVCSGTEERVIRFALIVLALHALAATSAETDYGLTLGKGYQPRPCGFDMNRNGVVGELADAKVGDGFTTDPDGDGVVEDIIYVDSAAGSDALGEGTPAKPYATIQKALSVVDGPSDGAEDIICIAGIFHETVTLPASGVPGHYVRDGFQFPRHPIMLVGWDKDGDHEYPPYDKDDVAVLDGRYSLAWAIVGRRKQSYIITNAGSKAQNLAVTYAPTDLVASGNIYDPSASFRWNERRHWITLKFPEWQTAKRQDAHSRLGTPSFVDLPSGDLHLDPSDTVARDFGVDITDITDHDFDGEKRSSTSLACGAACPTRAGTEARR